MALPKLFHPVAVIANTLSIFKSEYISIILRNMSACKVTAAADTTSKQQSTSTLLRVKAQAWL